MVGANSIDPWRHCFDTRIIHGLNALNATTHSFRNAGEFFRLGPDDASSSTNDQGRTDVLIQDMTREMSICLLKGTHVGRIACAQGSQPYVTPFSFAYHEDFIYSFATVGKKIEWMRANPLVCVEVENIVSREEWQTIVIFGRYQELPGTSEFHDARLAAHDLLARTAVWWEPGYVKTLHQGLERPFQPIYFRILINEISGHQGIADAPPA
jgi:hypothetical protein